MAVQIDPREAQVRETFFAELDARIPAFNRALLRLERSASDATQRDTALRDLFREAHNLKAAARAVDQAEIEHVAGALEANVVDARRPGEQARTAPWFDAAYALVDSLVSLRSQPVARQPDDPFANVRLQPVDSQPVARPEPPPPPPPPPPLPLPVVSQQAARMEPEPPRTAVVETVRVGVDKLDALLAQAGELSVAHLRIRQRQRELRVLRDEVDASQREWRLTRGVRATLRRGGQPSRQMEAVLALVDQAEQRSELLLQHIDDLSLQLGHDTAQLGLVTHAVEDEVMAVRLLPVATVTILLERTLRDVARSTGKEVQLIIEGGDTVIDRKILQQVRDPLLHLMRNAVDHGIESPDVRIAAGKPRYGTVRVSAELRGGFVEIKIADDGAGLDPAHLRASAVRKDLLSDAQALAMDDASILTIIFEPGFSTRSAVTELSGRGVGLDIVRQRVEQLDGRVMVDTSVGQGTRFTLRVPLTLATTRAILLEDGGQPMALPVALIERSARVRERDIVSFEGRRAVIIEGRPVALTELAAILERPPGRARRPEEWRQLVILAQGDRRLAILTDNLIGEREIVVKRLGWPLQRVPNVGGAAVLRSGETVVILNATDLLKNGSRLAQSTPGPTGVARSATPRHRLLVADDSLTTRTLLRSILEAAGYDVVVAVDGLEALARLRTDSIDLVISDVEMPRMSGYELTEAIRRDERLRQIPVVLVTSLSSRAQRERGMTAGADAYIVKASFAQGQLLDTVGRLV